MEGWQSKRQSIVAHGSAALSAHCSAALSATLAAVLFAAFTAHPSAALSSAVLLQLKELQCTGLCTC